MEKLHAAAVIDGKKIAAGIRAGLREEIAGLEKRGIKPGLTVILMGENPASQVYVRNKGRASEEAGIHSTQHLLPESTSQAELLALINRLNASKDVHGILVQIPLPAHIDSEAVIEAISPAKDVDGFHPYNIGRLMIGKPTLQPCTPCGIMKLIETTGVDISGKDAVVVGRSNIVGKPMAMMLLQRNATVTICHSRTKDLPAKVRSADIVVAAVGMAEFVKGEWIKEGAVVIDVGINRAASGSLVGDVKFESAAQRASYITPVPGGVGPMTIAMLLQNTVEAAKRQAGL
ncbi:MAG: bifunctional methylenetetrahydrofolate dehydrogenase/methenyltetrahydrofolate cyclohydrolase FolD [Deltaproteobacteria bacterium]|nr:bifunctional methylenetetrahydrofolate dehydrogenase/methenyltetrahydrofolate cyclohydrolase FolD [Deltaproteobacteria bacterium]